MKIHTIECGNFKLDGGAMFGVVPKTLWTRTNPADSNNMIDIATRSLLIEDGDSLILIDTGLGDKQSEKFFSYYHLWGDHSLDKSLKTKGFTRDDITDVVLTHLHFDHCGGAVKRSSVEGEYEPAFANARVWSNEAHWQWAVQPNAREKASFLKENILPLQEHGQLNFVEVQEDSWIVDTPLNMEMILVNGHTDKMMLPKIQYKGHTLVYAADLIPTAGHLPLVYVMGYDTRPLLTLQEKERFLEQAWQENWVIAFEHDAHNELATLKKTDRGIQIDALHTYKEIFGED
ncbi:MAG: MBL fold metallo-hydrolase [Weeksellaceae bacterium]|nr:MBL fold metallo-hydrolase [Weeksellaceae bacterium]